MNTEKLIKPISTIFNYEDGDGQGFLEKYYPNPLQTFVFKNEFNWGEGGDFFKNP